MNRVRLIFFVTLGSPHRALMRRTGGESTEIELTAMYGSFYCSGLSCRYNPNHGHDVRPKNYSKYEMVVWHSDDQVRR